MTQPEETTADGAAALATAALVDAAAVAAATTGPRIDIVGGNPTSTEVAAVTAVLAGVLEEISGHIEATDEQPKSAWARAQRPIRVPMHPGAGMWRGFSG